MEKDTHHQLRPSVEEHTKAKKGSGINLLLPYHLTVVTIDQTQLEIKGQESLLVQAWGTSWQEAEQSGYGRVQGESGGANGRYLMYFGNLITSPSCFVCAKDLTQDIQIFSLMQNMETFFFVSFLVILIWNPNHPLTSDWDAHSYIVPFLWRFQLYVILSPYHPHAILSLNFL